MSQVVASAPAFATDRLIRAAVRGLPSYTRESAPASASARRIRLDWNESPYGPSPKARAALAGFDSFHRYPEIDAWTLRSALANYIGASTDQVVPGAGLDDVFATLALMLIEPGDRVIISEPTFGMYRPLFALHGAEVVDVPLTSDVRLDPTAILAASTERTKLIVICNPNNPTGTLFDPASIEAIIASAGCLVAIDEAYAEFAGVTHLPLMARYPNLAVLRTMSKFAGLAGMRVGYGVFPSDLMPYLMRTMPAFGNVGAASTAAAIASLEDLDYLNGIVQRIVADRDQLATDLAMLPGVEPYPSATNFLLVRLPVADAASIVARLGAAGVFVRHFPRPEFGLVPCLRVSIGTSEENAIFLTELQRILHEAGTWG
ncbi:MAG: histidinol-phosphate transaminase [Chloroflexia bacterium]|nr:histidinol-phosphate transaminase [Chloroflexia bacterium]